MVTPCSAQTRIRAAYLSLASGFEAGPEIYSILLAPCSQIIWRTSSSIAVILSIVILKKSG